MSIYKSATLAAVLVSLLATSALGQQTDVHSLTTHYIGGYGDWEEHEEWKAGRQEAIEIAKASAHLELSLIQLPAIVMDYLLMPTGIQYSQSIEIVEEGVVFITPFDAANPSYEPFGSGQPSLFWSGPWLVQYKIKYRYVDP